MEICIRTQKGGIIMKKILVLFFLLNFSCLVQASDIADTFTEKYTELAPRENSSVNSDYVFEQIALGSQYTIKMLDQLNDKNGNSNLKMGIMIEKFEVLINQNNKIIELLEKLIKKPE